MQVHPSSLDSDIHPHFSCGKWGMLPATPSFQAVLPQTKHKIYGIRNRRDMEQLYSVSHSPCLTGAYLSHALTFGILIEERKDWGMQGCSFHLNSYRSVKGGNDSVDSALLTSFPRAKGAAMHSMKWRYGLWSCAKCCVTQGWKPPNPLSINKGNGEVIYCKINKNAINLKREMHWPHCRVWEELTRQKGE